ncbi:UNVERIFIED_CONTAM: hypothetical protein Slati_0134300 [Sesamum latifolium]|uniref:Uncharacterized protein n=1 Tax=Sesamum latifolium TaxID=2727402 RepID=A0AAW2Y9F1_9LAMI
MRERDPRRKKSPYAVFRYAYSPSAEVVCSERNCGAHDVACHHQMKEGSMCHPSDAEAWKHFYRMYHDFAQERSNVRLDLCIGGFALHGQYGRTYSYWLVILTPYNFSLGMCMSFEYIFLTMMILGPSNSKRLIDVYLEPLIEQLFRLWHVGFQTYDNATDQTFIMRAALMWTVNDLSAYGMASGWSTASIMGCPVCMFDTRTFHLQHGRKACYIDCRRQFLPEDHPYRRNKKAFTKNRVEYKVAREADRRADPRLGCRHQLNNC